MQNSFVKKTSKSGLSFDIKCAKLYDYYIGDYAKHKNKIINDRFLNLDAAENIDIWFTYVPIIEKIIHITSNTYTEPAKRFLINGSEKENKAYEEIQRTSKMIVSMPELERLVNLLGTVVVKVSWRNGGIVYDTLLPQNVNVETDPNDSTTPIRIAYKGQANIGGKIKTITHVWTKDNYYILDSKGKELVNPDNKDNENPYKDKDGNGILPFVVIRQRYYTGGFFCPPPFDLITLAETVAIKLTDIQYATHKETRVILWMYGCDEYGDVKDVNIDRLTAFFVPRLTEMEGKSTVGTPDAKFLSPNSPIKALWDSLEKTVRLSLTNHNIALRNFELGKTPAGVESLKFSAEPLEKEQKNIRNVRRIDEHDLFNMTRIVWNYYAKRGNKIKLDTEFKVDFGEYKQPYDEATNLTITQQKINLGTMSTIDAMMEQNPDLNRKEAEAEVLRVQEEEKRIKGDTEERDKALAEALDVEPEKEEEISE